MITTTLTTTKKTVIIDWTSAAKVRMTANVDMPEYGLKAQQVFYLVRSSANDGTYYILVWSYEAIKWGCPCKHSVERPNAKPCRHRRIVSVDCKTRSVAREAIEQLLHKNIDTFLAKERKGRTVTEVERTLSAAGFMR